MKTKLLTIVSLVATLAAVVVSSSACWWWSYQPEEPSSLNDR